MSNLEGFARQIAAYIYSVVLEDEYLLTSSQFLHALKIEELHFDPNMMRESCSRFQKEKPAKSTKTSVSFASLFRKPPSHPGFEKTGLTHPAKLSIVAGTK